MCDGDDARIFKQMLDSRVIVNSERKKYHKFTINQAYTIAEFLLSIKDEIKILICQSDNGENRSVALTDALERYFYKKKIDYSPFDDSSPRNLIIRQTSVALERISNNTFGNLNTLN